MHIPKIVRPILQTIPDPCPPGSDRDSWECCPEFTRVVESYVGSMNYHSHTSSCHEGKSGLHGCRYAHDVRCEPYPSTICIELEEVEVIDNTNNDQIKKKIIRAKEYDENESMEAFTPMPFGDIMKDSKHPFPKSDDKLVVYVMHRPGYEFSYHLDYENISEPPNEENGFLPYPNVRHVLEHANPNGNVVQFSDIVTACLACNTAMMFNGNEESAKNSMEYQTKVRDEERREKQRIERERFFACCLFLYSYTFVIYKKGKIFITRLEHKIYTQNE
jgi:hypothetical protein